MKPIIFISFLILAVIPVRMAGQPTLYPPLNLQSEGIECNVYITWDKPELPGGGTPAGILGYRVYKEGSFLAYVSGQDTTWYYDLAPQPCPSNIHTYWVTAYYDLASYGYPGQFGESSSTDTNDIAVICSCCLPFHEYWDQSSFSYNDWGFSPTQSNWAMSNPLGTPPPAAIFTGIPEIQNYSVTLQSRFLPTYDLGGCTDLYLDFDLKLDNTIASGSELMTVVLEHCGEPVDTVLTVLNNSGFDWTHSRILINDGRGGSSRILFTASGQNSTNFQQWLLDNIIVSFTCRPPVNPALEIISNTIHLSWDPPVCDNGADPGIFITGYYVYRSDSTGMPPFTRITANPVTGNTYTDVIADWNTPAVYKYYITDCQNDTSLNTFLCESVPSDTLTALYTGTGSEMVSGFTLSPNPTTGKFSLKVPENALEIEISDLKGSVIYSESCSRHPGEQIIIDLTGQPKGIYILTVSKKTGNSRGKIILY